MRLENLRVDIEYGVTPALFFSFFFPEERKLFLGAVGTVQRKPVELHTYYSTTGKKHTK